MKKYKLKFEFYGRKMQTIVEANNDEQAREIVRNRVSIIECNQLPVSLEEDPFVKQMNSIFNRHKSKK